MSGAGETEQLPGPRLHWTQSLTALRDARTRLITLLRQPIKQLEANRKLKIGLNSATVYKKQNRQPVLENICVKIETHRGGAEN